MLHAETYSSSEKLSAITADLTGVAELEGNSVIFNTLVSP